MRKYFIVMAAVLLCCSVAFGQKTNKTSVGVKLGLNLSQFRLPVDYPDYDAQWKAGIAGGIFIERKLSKKFDLQIDFLYSQMGAEVNDPLFGHNYRFNYFSMPLIAKWNFYKSMKLFAGPQCDILLRGTDRMDGEGTQVVTNNTEDIDLGWTVGVEGWVQNKVCIGVRYMSGTKDLSPANETFTAYNQGFQITVGYKLFPCTKKKK